MLEELRANIVLRKLEQWGAPRQSGRYRVRGGRPDGDAVAVVRPKETLPHECRLAVRTRELEQPAVGEGLALPGERQPMDLRRGQVPRQYQQPKQISVPVRQFGGRRTLCA